MIAINLYEICNKHSVHGKYVLKRICLYNFYTDNNSNA